MKNPPASSLFVFSNHKPRQKTNQYLLLAIKTTCIAADQSIVYPQKAHWATNVVAQPIQTT
jgi:hypothetical protein